MTTAEYEILDAWFTGTCSECGGAVNISMYWESGACGGTYSSKPISADRSCVSCQARLAKTQGPVIEMRGGDD